MLWRRTRPYRLELFASTVCCVLIRNIIFIYVQLFQSDCCSFTYSRKLFVCLKTFLCFLDQYDRAHSKVGLYIRAGSRQSSPASLPGFAGYFHCFTSQDMSRWCLSGLKCTKLLGLNKYTFAVPIFSENIQKTQGQFKNAILETVFLNKSCCSRRNLRTLNTICYPPYWMHN